MMLDTLFLFPLVGAFSEGKRPGSVPFLECFDIGIRCEVLDLSISTLGVEI